MSGQEGDTRQFRRLRSTDYYASKAAFQQKEAKPAKCKVCKQEIIGQNFNGYCMRCHDEPL